MYGDISISISIIVIYRRKYEKIRFHSFHSSDRHNRQIRAQEQYPYLVRGAAPPPPVDADESVIIELDFCGGNSSQAWEFKIDI